MMLWLFKFVALVRYIHTHPLSVFHMRTIYEFLMPIMLYVMSILYISYIYIGVRVLVPRYGLEGTISVCKENEGKPIPYHIILSYDNPIITIISYLIYQSPYILYYEFYE